MFRHSACALVGAWLFFSISAFGQGTPATLQCALNTPLDVHATRASSSPIVTKIKCGERLLLIDKLFASPHVRAGDGKEGFIIGLNLGQWSIEPDSSPSPELSSAMQSGKQLISVIVVTHGSNPVTSNSTHQTSGSSQTTCGGGPATDGVVNCTTTYDSAQQHDITASKLDGVAKVKDDDGRIYTIACSAKLPKLAKWVGSNCGPLIDGDRYMAEIDETTMWISARKGGNQGKEVRSKYQILDIR